MLYNRYGLPDLKRQRRILVNVKRYEDDPYFVESLIRDQVESALSAAIEECELDGSAYFAAIVMLRFPVTIEPGLTMTVPLPVNIDFDGENLDFVREELCRANAMIASEVRRAWLTFRMPNVVSDAVEILRCRAKIGSPDRTVIDVRRALEALEDLAVKTRLQIGDLIDLPAVFSSSHGGRPATTPDLGGHVLVVTETGRLDFDSAPPAHRQAA